MTLSTYKEKAAWLMYARVNGIKPEQSFALSKSLDDYNKDLKYADEEDKDSIKVEDYIPNELKDLYEESKAYQGICINSGTHACFIAGTKVLTANGYKNIEDVKEGDYVLTHNNHYSLVKLIHKKKTQKLTTLKAGGQEVISTPNHKFLSRKPKCGIKGCLSESEWKPAVKLKKDDFVGMPINLNSKIPNQPYNLPFKDSRFWWIIGRWIGNGWTENPKGRTEKRVIICCGKENDDRNLNLIKEKLDGLFDYRFEEVRTTYKFHIKNLELYFWLQQFGSYAHGKSIPNFVLDLPINLLSCFLEGYLSADGYRRNNLIKFSTVSYDLFLMLREIVHKVYRRPVGMTVRKAQFYEIEERTVYDREQFCGTFKVDNSKLDVMKIDEDCVWYPISEIKTDYFEEEIDVYDLSVINDNSYTANGFAVHNCGFLILDSDIRREIGLISAKSETTGKRTLVACVEGQMLDEFGYVKQDFLIVDSVSLTKEMFDSIGEPVPSFEELKETVKNDQKTWDIYAKGITCCINQCEKEATTKKVMKYKPKTIAELSAFVAGVRPGFASLLNNFLNRKPYSIGEPKIDEILEDSSHYLLYQESIMKVLSFLGLPMTETYSVIKSISKKKLKGEKKDKLLQDLKKGWFDALDNYDNFNKVWKVVEDSANYSFNASHSYSMAGDSLYLAWFKAHHTSKFYEVAITHYQKKQNKNKIDDLIKEAIKFYGYKIGNYEFGADNRTINIDDVNKVIYPNLSSIKGFGDKVVSELYTASQRDFLDFEDVYKAVKETHLNSTQFSSLIKMEYFKKWGDPKRLLRLVEIFDLKATIKKSVSKSIIDKHGFNIDEALKYGRETKTKIMDFDKDAFFKEQIEKLKTDKTSKYDLIRWKWEITGMLDEIDQSFDSNIFFVVAIKVGKWISFVDLFNPYRGTTRQLKVYTRQLDTNHLEEGKFIRLQNIDWKIKNEPTGRILDNGKKEYKPSPSGEKDPFIGKFSVMHYD